ncbi:MAG: HrpB1 family type III secretion system apparatus protein [Burkholderiaceae bacterium]
MQPAANTTPMQPAADAPLPDYLVCSSDIIAGMVRLANAGTMQTYPKIIIDLNDLTLMADGMRLLRPKLEALALFDAHRHMALGQWSEAIHHFSALLERAPDFGAARVLLALCMYKLNKPDWKHFVAQGLDKDSEKEARRLIDTMIAHEDLQVEIAKAQAGRPFMLPPSCHRYVYPDAYGDESDAAAAADPSADAMRHAAELSLRQPAQSAPAPAPRAADLSVMHPSLYLRS